MAGFDLPPGYRWDLGRGFAEEQEQFGDMMMAGLLASLGTARGVHRAASPAATRRG